MIFFQNKNKNDGSVWRLPLSLPLLLLLLLLLLVLVFTVPISLSLRVRVEVRNSKPNSPGLYATLLILFCLMLLVLNSHFWSFLAFGLWGFLTSLIFTHLYACIYASACVLCLRRNLCVSVSTSIEGFEFWCCVLCQSFYGICEMFFFLFYFLVSNCFCNFYFEDDSCCCCCCCLWVDDVDIDDPNFLNKKKYSQGVLC